MHNSHKYCCNHNIVVSRFNYLLSYAFFRDIYFFCALSFGIFLWFDICISVWEWTLNKYIRC